MYDIISSGVVSVRLQHHPSSHLVCMYLHSWSGDTWMNEDLDTESKIVIEGITTIVNQLLIDNMELLHFY